MDVDDTSPSGKAQLELGQSLAALEAQLNLLLSLESSRSLRLAALEGRPAVELDAPVKAGGALLEPDGLRLGAVASPASRTAGEPFADLLQKPALKSALSGLSSREMPARSAAELMQGLVRDDRRSFRLLSTWAPLLSPAIYSIAARISAVLDLMRDEVRSAFVFGTIDHDQRAISYYGLLRVMERATLLATDAGGDWLVAMASSFEWTSWTPSFPLSRERTLIGALVGARAASRFGPGVVDLYLDALFRAQHPTKALDSLLALTAIGVRFPDNVETIARRLEAAAAKLSAGRMDRIDLVAEANAQALRLLAKGRTASPLVMSDWRQDSFSRDGVGHMLVFRLLTAAVEVPAWRFVPARATPQISPASAKDSFARAWGGAPQRAGPWVSGVGGHA